MIRGWFGESDRSGKARGPIFVHSLNLTEVSTREGHAKALVPTGPLPEGRGGFGNISIRQGKPRGPVSEDKAASMFEVTMITESANHMCYRVSLRSSSKRVPSNPSPYGVRLCSNAGS